MCRNFRRCVKSSMQSFQKGNHQQAISEFLKNLRRSKCTEMILDGSFLLQSKLRMARSSRKTPQKNDNNFEAVLQSYRSHCCCQCSK
jgi:hypothetical protein